MEGFSGWVCYSSQYTAYSVVHKGERARVGQNRMESGPVRENKKMALPLVIQIIQSARHGLGIRSTDRVGGGRFPDKPRKTRTMRKKDGVKKGK